MWNTSVGHQYQTKTRFGVLHVQRTWDANYEGKVPLLPKVSMLPLTKEQLALHECVGGECKKASADWDPCLSDRAGGRQTNWEGELRREGTCGDRGFGVSTSTNQNG